HLVALEADRELDRAARIDLLDADRAALRADDDEALAAGVDEHEPRANRRREAMRRLELDGRDRLEIRRLVQRDARRLARHHREHVRRPDERDVAIVERQRELADRWRRAAREQDDILAVACCGPLRVGAGDQAPHYFLPKPRMILTSPSSSSGVSRSCGWPGIIGLLPTR